MLRRVLSMLHSVCYLMLSRIAQASAIAHEPLCAAATRERCRPPKTRSFCRWTRAHCREFIDLSRCSNHSAVRSQESRLDWSSMRHVYGLQMQIRRDAVRLQFVRSVDGLLDRPVLSERCTCRDTSDVLACHRRLSAGNAAAAAAAARRAVAEGRFDLCILQLPSCGHSAARSDPSAEPEVQHWDAFRRHARARIARRTQRAVCLLPT